MVTLSIHYFFLSKSIVCFSEAWIMISNTVCVMIAWFQIELIGQMADHM